jgi:hypothetical protein
MRLDIYNNKGLSDIYLIGNPQISYFSKVYRKHSPFTTKRIKVGCKDGNNNNRIDHHGELIKSIDLEIKITGNTHVPGDNIGTSLLNEIKIEIGGKEIEKLTGTYLEMYMKLKNPRSLQTFYNASGTNLICSQGTMEQILSLSGGVFNNTGVNAGNVNIILPIPFSFCDDIGHALPYFLFYFNKPLYISFLINTNPYGAKEYNFIINYIILSNEEKMRFRSSNNEYLYETVHKYILSNNSFTGEQIYNIDKIYGNIKSIMWENTISKNYKYNISINNNLLLNQNKSYHYFTRKTIQDAGYLGGGITKSGGSTHIINNDSIAFYSFALKDYKGDYDSYTPSGSVSSHKNQIKFIIENVSTASPPDIHFLYIKSYNIMNIKENYFQIEYQHAGF